MDETVFMQKIQRGKNRGQHSSGFVRRERAARKKLAQIFVGAFGNDVKAGSAVNYAAAKIKNAQESRMRESGGSAPVLELRVGARRIFGNEFDRGVNGSITGVRRFDRSEKYRRIWRDAEKFAERETAVRELAKKMLRRC